MVLASTERLRLPLRDQADKKNCVFLCTAGLAACQTPSAWVLSNKFKENCTENNPHLSNFWRCIHVNRKFSEEQRQTFTTNTSAQKRKQFLDIQCSVG